MKRSTGLLALMALVVALVVGSCGGEGATPTSPPATPTTARPATTPAATQPATSAVTPSAGSPSAGVPTATPVASAAAPTATAAPAVKRGGTLRTRVTSDPVPWEVPKGSLSNTYPMFFPVMSTLLQATPNNETRITGDLAESFSVSADGKVLTFKLVKGAQFHDGTPLTSAEIKTQYDKIFFNAEYNSFLRGFFTAGDRTEAPDSSTFIIYLKQPSNSFLANLTSPFMLVYSPRVPASELEKGKVIGSGPFMWEKYEVGIRVTEKANPNFFRKDPQGNRLPYLDAIEINIIKDQAAHLAAFRTGRIDVVDLTGGPALVGQVEGLKQAIPGLRTGFDPATLFDTILIKNTPPFDNLKVRQAMQYGLDRKLFVDAALEGNGFGSGFAHPGPHFGGQFGVPQDVERTFPGMNPANRAQDLATARALMKDAGYTPDTPLKVTMYVGETGTQVLKATAAAGALRDAGFDITLGIEDTASHNKRLVLGGVFQLIYRNFRIGLDDPTQSVGTIWTSDAPRNYSGWSDPEVDRLFKEQETVTDLSKRPALIQEMLKRIYTQAYNVVVAWSQTPWVVKPEVKNFPLGANAGRHEITWLDK